MISIFYDIIYIIIIIYKIIVNLWCIDILIECIDIPLIQESFQAGIDDLVVSFVPGRRRESPHKNPWIKMNPSDGPTFVSFCFPFVLLVCLLVCFFVSLFVNLFVSFQQQKKKNEWKKKNKKKVFKKKTRGRKKGKKTICFCFWNGLTDFCRSRTRLMGRLHSTRLG